MFLDAQNQYSDAQALSATAVSTNAIDHGADRDFGIGEPMVVLIVVDVALAGTTPTFQATLQADDNVGFASPGTVGSTASFSALAVGARMYLNLPPDKSTERYSRLNYTLGGTTPTITVTSGLIPLRAAQAENVFAGGFLVS